MNELLMTYPKGYCANAIAAHDVHPRKCFGEVEKQCMKLPLLEILS